jgi:hypothetical protein
VARGLSDASGQAALYFPYPKIVLPNPVGNRPPLSQITWPVDLKIFAGPVPPPGSPPDICAVYAQPAASPLRQLGPNKPLQTLDLTYGQELVVQTKNKSELFLG